MKKVEKRKSIKLNQCHFGKEKLCFLSLEKFYSKFFKNNCGFATVCLKNTYKVVSFMRWNEFLLQIKYIY